MSTPGMPKGGYVFMADGGPPEGEKTRIMLRNFFNDEANVKKIESPISEQQKAAWLEFIVPEIEKAYGVKVYTDTPKKLEETQGKLEETQRKLNDKQGELDKALEEIRSFYKTFKVDPNGATNGH